MQITALRIGIKDKERVNVFVDDKFRIAIDKNTLTQEHLFVGKEITNDLINKLKDVDTYNLITRKVISWCYARPRSSKEISEKIQKILKNRSSSSFNSKLEIIDLNEYVTNKLNELGFNNTTYGTWLVENRAHQGRYGKQRILSELMNKGLSSTLAKELVTKYYPEDSNKAEELLIKKFGVKSVKLIKDPNIRNKAYRFLISKGFKII